LWREVGKSSKESRKIMGMCMEITSLFIRGRGPPGDESGLCGVGTPAPWDSRSLRRRGEKGSGAKGEGRRAKRVGCRRMCSDVVKSEKCMLAILSTSQRSENDHKFLHDDITSHGELIRLSAATPIHDMNGNAPELMHPRRELSFSTFDFRLSTQDVT
jgi:hypothetical protein